MFNKFIWIYIFPILFISPILSLSMNSWFSIWISLELNLMMFIPLIIFFNKYHKELAIKYFIVQAFSSSMLIIFSNMLMMFNSNFYLTWINLMINMSLLIKIGAPPFHSWFVKLMSNFNWLNCLILSTWQKIIPFIMLSYSFSPLIIFISVILSSLIGSIFGTNHSSLRLIFSYSSINHISWLLMNILINENSWIFYFFTYFILNFSVMMIFHQFNIYYMNQILFINKKFKYIIFFNFFSLSSLPPMYGFMIKWFSIFILFQKLFYTVVMILIFLSLFTFLFYTRIIIYILTMYKNENKLSIFNKMLSLNNSSFFYISIMFFFNLWILNIWLI
uniref:NADH-ubiquinone oxidoreductase chain 2 n=1 Tax=Hypsicera sp. ZJUH_2016019 TaxID=2491161 RepID=A0A3Q8UA33_9HYME|nr:NADH dehydrogenase subunit 2 [Hypsicera sp. ZJUH_2016019]